MDRQDLSTGNEQVMTNTFCVTCHANANDSHPMETRIQKRSSVTMSSIFRNDNGFAGPAGGGTAAAHSGTAAAVIGKAAAAGRRSQARLSTAFRAFRQRT
jgi:hypothetical protein